MKNPYLNLIATVWRYGTSWHRTIIGYYAAFIIAQISMSLMPYTVGRTIDALQNFKPGHLSNVIFWLVAGVTVLLIFWLFHGPGRVIERKVALKIQQKFRLNLYEKLTQLPLSWHQDHHSGNLITRLNRAATALHKFAENQFIYIESIIKFLVSIGFLFWISPPIGLFSLVISVFLMMIIILFDRKLIPLYDAENEVDNHVGAVLFDYVSNMTTVLTLRLGELTHANLYQRIMSVWPFFRKEVVWNEAKWFTIMILLSCIQAILLIAYIIHSLHLTGAVMIGTVVMLFRYQWDLDTVFYDLSVHFSDLVRMDTDVRGLNPVLEDIQKYAHVPQGEKVARQWHTFEISDLTFHHFGKTEHEKLFNRIGFSVKRGEKIALIGSSGDGKSTLLNILCGLYKPSQVKLMIDGISFDSLEPLRAITTLIPQDPEIFENTIIYNITLDLPATQEEINHVVQLAGFTAVLKTLPNGLETDIREKGLNLSVGQKQRLALARGLFAARFSSLILMDEPTSSVDLPTEKEILSGVIHAFPNTAMIVSLHRLHLLPQFDSIIMLQHGKIVAAGPTAELLNHPGPVCDLWMTYRE